jgi:hypothetical protein
MPLFTVGNTAKQRHPGCEFPRGRADGQRTRRSGWGPTAGPTAPSPPVNGGGLVSCGWAQGPVTPVGREGAAWSVGTRTMNLRVREVLRGRTLTRRAPTGGADFPRASRSGPACWRAPTPAPPTSMRRRPPGRQPWLGRRKHGTSPIRVWVRIGPDNSSLVTLRPPRYSTRAVGMPDAQPIGSLSEEWGVGQEGAVARSAVLGLDSRRPPIREPATQEGLCGVSNVSGPPRKLGGTDYRVRAGRTSRWGWLRAVRPRVASSGCPSRVVRYDP